MWDNFLRELHKQLLVIAPLTNDSIRQINWSLDEFPDFFALSFKNFVSQPPFLAKGL